MLKRCMSGSVLDKPARQTRHVLILTTTTAIFSSQSKQDARYMHQFFKTRAHADGSVLLKSSFCRFLIFSKLSFQSQSARQSSRNACCSAISFAEATEGIERGTKAFGRGTLSEASKTFGSFPDFETGNLPGASFDNELARAVGNKTSCSS